MRDLDDFVKLYFECVAELKRIGIEPGPVRDLVLGGLPDNAFGYCRYYGKEKVYDIHLSYGLDDERISDTVVKSFIIHEILHTLPGCMNHDDPDGWDDAADYVMERYAQYNLRARTRQEIYDLA